MQHDLERGERIKALREQAHFTQPAVAERVGVTLRAYQKWEEGGGLAWENLEALADLHHVAPQYIASGETPDVLASLNGHSSDQLDRIENRLDTIYSMLLPLTAQLEAPPQEAASTERTPAAKKTRQAAS